MFHYFNLPIINIHLITFVLPQDLTHSPLDHYAPLVSQVYSESELFPARMSYYKLEEDVPGLLIDGPIHLHRHKGESRSYFHLHDHPHAPSTPIIHPLDDNKCMQADEKSSHLSFELLQCRRHAEVHVLNSLSLLYQEDHLHSTMHDLLHHHISFNRSFSLLCEPQPLFLLVDELVPFQIIHLFFL